MTIIVILRAQTEPCLRATAPLECVSEINDGAHVEVQHLLRSRWLVPTLLLLATLALYAPTLRYQTVNYDDPWLLEANTKLQQLSVAEVPALFTDFSAATRNMLGAEYLPIRDLSIGLDYAVWGHWYQGFHLTQVVLYALTVMLLYIMLRGFGLSLKVALAATALWAVHPIHVESVAWLTERKGVLAAFFVVATGCAYLRYRNQTSSRPRLWLTIAAALAACAVWSKAVALFALGGIAMLDVCLLSADARRWRGLAAIGVTALLAFVPVFATAHRANVIITEDLADGTAGGDGKLQVAVGLIGHYTRSLALTERPAIVYRIEHEGPTAGELAIGGIVVLLGLGWTVWSLQRKRYLAPYTAAGLAALGWFACSFFPVSRLMFPIKIVAADRYMLLPSLAMTLLIGLGLAAIKRTRAYAVALGLCVAVATMITLLTQPMWQSSTALFAHSVQQRPQLAELWLRWGSNVVSEQGDIGKAEAIIDRALELHPTDASLILKKSDFRASANDLAGAEAWLRKGAALTYARCYDRLARLMAAHDRFAEAVTWAEQAVAKRPEEPTYRQTLAESLMAARRIEEAIAQWREVVRLAPTVGIGHFELGRALWHSGKRTEAIPYLQVAVGFPEFSQAATQLLRAP